MDYSADVSSRFSLWSLLVWTTLVGMLVGFGQRWHLYSFGICVLGLLLWPAGPIVHAIASRLDARGGTETSVLAAGLYAVGAITFTYGIIAIVSSVVVLIVELIVMLAPG